jgi:hypothetical protein
MLKLEHSIAARAAASSLREKNRDRCDRVKFLSAEKTKFTTRALSQNVPAQPCLRAGVLPSGLASRAGGMTVQSFES